MYYYIFEPAKNKRDYNQQEDIKAILQKNQVAGEFVTLSLAEKPQDLAKIGLRRGFSTIVAVGSDSLINQVASGLIGTDYAFGAIPIESKSKFLKIINARDYEEACLALPYRRINQIDTGIINRKNSIITQASIRPKSGKPELIQVNFDNHYRTEIRLDEIVVANIGAQAKVGKVKQALSDSLIDIYIPAKSKVSKGLLSIFSNLSQEKSKGGSIFHVKKALIQSKKPLDIYLGDQIVDSSPFQIETNNSSLNMIIKREKVKNLDKTQK